jgi:hypothetical protein
MGAFMLCRGSALPDNVSVGVDYTPDLKSSRAQYARALVFCQVRGGDPNFVRLSFTAKARLRCTRLFLRSAAIDHVVLVLCTVETFDPIHLTLVSLAVFSALMWLCEKVVGFILERRREDIEREMKNFNRATHVGFVEGWATIAIVIAGSATVIAIIGHG